jgi:hypothetical protein
VNTGAGHYLFIDALNCGTPGVVSTADETCKVFHNTNGESFANWDAMALAHPDWRIPGGKVPFVIAEYQGTYELSNIALR